MISVALQEDAARTIGRKGLVHCSFYQLEPGHLFLPLSSLSVRLCDPMAAATATRGSTALTTRGVYDIGTWDLVLKALAGQWAHPYLLPKY